jgi:copper oxidase (laccase) domain-containing protein
LPHFFTDRRKGSSLGVYDSLNFGFHVGDDPVAVAANRALLGNAQFMNQVHGNDVVVIDQVLDHEPTCDALITTSAGVALAVMVADCIPLLLISERK